MKRYKITIAYDGTHFSGWQRQPLPARTVQREIEKAAGNIVSHPVTVQGVSRTDAGVHAMGQVAAINLKSDLDAAILRKAINSRLPPDILIRTMEETSINFDVRHAKNKRYRYLIWADQDRPIFQRHFVYHFYRPLDLPLMQTACADFLGTHDFKSFKGQTDHRDHNTRTIFHCSMHRHGPLILFAVEGSGFRYHMVRTMVGTLIQIGTHYRPPDCIPPILAAKDRAAAGPSAPAQGLHLQWIRF